MSNASTPEDHHACNTCDWWKRLREPFRKGFNEQMGMCRKYAPRPYVADHDPMTMWPITYERDWCGQHSDVE